MTTASNNSPFEAFFYRAESIFTEDNPWDGRTCYGNYTTLDAAKAALETVYGLDPGEEWHMDANGDYGSHVVCSWYLGDDACTAIQWIFKEGLTRD